MGDATLGTYFFGDQVFCMHLDPKIARAVFSTMYDIVSTTFRREGINRLIVIYLSLLSFPDEGTRTLHRHQTR